MKLALVIFLNTVILFPLAAQIFPQALFVNKQYKFVVIGTQTWMTENLNIATYRDGTSIGNAATTSEWITYVNNPGTGNGAWVYPTAADGSGNFLLSNPDYGKLYNWYAITDTRGLCPTNWHVPSRVEWRILYNYLGGASTAGGKLKESGTAHWAAGNVATNTSGYTALPGGYMGGGASLGNSPYGYYWASDDISSTMGYTYLLYPSSAVIDSTNMGKVGGSAVRCIHD